MKKTILIIAFVFFGCISAFAKNWDITDGIYLFNNKNFNDAENFFKGYIKVYPNDTDGYYYLGLIYKEKDDLNNSIFYLKKSFELTNNIIDVNIAPQVSNLEYSDYIDLAQIYIDLKNYDMAISYLDMLEAINPDNAKALYMKAEIYLAQDKEDFAKQCFLKAIEIDNSLLDSDVGISLNITKIPKFSAEFYNARGLQYFYADDLDNAGKNFEKAIKSEIYNAEAYNNLGYVYMKMGEKQKAQRNFEKAVIFDRHMNFAYLNLAKIFKNDSKKELHYIKKAIKANPNDARNYLAMGEFLFENDKFEEAIDYFKKTISIDENMYEAQTQLGISYLKLNKEDEAIKTFRKLIQKSDNPEIYYYLSNLCIKENKLGEGSEYLKEAIKKGENPFYYLKLGEIELQLKNYEPAKEYLEIAEKMFSQINKTEEVKKAKKGLRQVEIQEF